MEVSTKIVYGNNAPCWKKKLPPALSEEKMTSLFFGRKRPLEHFFDKIDQGVSHDCEFSVAVWNWTNLAQEIYMNSNPLDY